MPPATGGSHSARHCTRPPPQENLRYGPPAVGAFYPVASRSTVLPIHTGLVRHPLRVRVVMAGGGVECRRWFYRSPPRGKDDRRVRAPRRVPSGRLRPSCPQVGGAG